MRELAAIVHRQRSTVEREVARLAGSTSVADKLQAGAMKLGLFAARVILKTPPCVASVSVPAEVLGIAAATPREMLAELLARVQGERLPENPDTRRN